MRTTGNLMKRNILIFMRDSGRVFFSILSMLIILGLMILFLGNMNSEDIVCMLEQSGGARDAAADRANADYLVSMWTLAGILLSNAVTVTMTAMGSMVEDEACKRLASFYVAPVKRVHVAFGYIFSAWVIGIVMCLITLTAFQGYLAVTGQALLAVTGCFRLLGMIVLNTFLYAAAAYLLALFIHSVGAWSGLLTVIGTLVGFVGAVYLPVAVLPEKVADVLKYLPVLHGAAMMRVVCTEDAIETAFAGLPAEAAEVFRENMGITVVMGNGPVSFAAQAACLLVFGLAAVVTAAAVSRKRAVYDR
ncbi:MAG: ABC transporter permease [Blautia sp.]|nr:ABC transporter permease [Blautia sp.]MCM1201153.1 ABC transporter permease [Bacteroides fragilis]